MAHYSTDDIKSLLDYASRLEEEGKIDDAIAVYDDAAILGSTDAIEKVESLKNLVANNKKTLMKKKKKVKENKKSNSEKSKSLRYFFIFLFSFATITALPIGLSLLNNLTGTGDATANSSIFSSKGIADDISKNDNAEVTLQILGNALLNYKAERGVYPKEITDLARFNPENWVSYIPENISYITSGESFILTLDKLSVKPTNIKPIKLILYPNNNFLTLYIGEEAQFNFLVSSSQYPATDTTELTVTKRIVYPNGQGSPYGSRALALSNGTAIHGTNNPISIGYRNTEGSIGMNDKNIELLYSYVSIGTKVSISTDVSPTPKYQNYLPQVVPDEYDFEQETDYDAIYSWK